MSVISKIKQFCFCEVKRQPYFRLENDQSSSANSQKNRNKLTFGHDMKILSKYFKPWNLRIKSLVLKEIGHDQQPLYEEDVEIVIERYQTEEVVVNKRKLAYDALCLKDETNLSTRNWTKISKATGLPSNYHISALQKKANHLFKIHADNPLGFYNDPIAKIKFVVQRYIEKTHASRFEDLRLKISCDGLQLTKTHRTVLNVTFTLINERKRACTSKGNYILGLFEIESENYEEVNVALKEILESLKALTTIRIGSTDFNIKKYLGGDLKCLACLYGINSAIADCPCIWCVFDVKLNSKADGFWPISRTFVESYNLLNDSCKTVKQRKGYIKKPIVDFIDFDCCVVDTLHLFLRITECLLRHLFVLLDQADVASDTTALSDRQNLSVFLNFLKTECKIYGPYYIKTNRDTGKVKIKLRSLNTNEFETFFKNLTRLPLHNLLPNLGLEGMSFILNEFFQIYLLIKVAESSSSIDEIEKRLKKWVSVYTQLGAANSNKFTPYIHVFVHHIPEFIRLHGCIDFFNCQGLEKLNHIIKLAYFSNSNKNSRIYLRQVLEKRNREEFREHDGTIEEMDSMTMDNGAE